MYANSKDLDHPAQLCRVVHYFTVCVGTKGPFMLSAIIKFQFGLLAGR